MVSRGGGSAAASAAATVWGALVFLTDLLPPRVRYGYVHRLTHALFRRPLPALAPPVGAATDAPAATPSPEVTARAALTCVLAADRLDIGGIGTVIEMLAGGLGAHGVRAVVVCNGDGTRAERLRAAGIEVLTASDEEAARRAISAVGPDVIQSHSAPPHIERAALASGIPLIPVMHNTEIHYTRTRWAAFAALMAGSVMGIAVSATVRDFHIRHVGDRTPIVVVPNGAPQVRPPSEVERERARAELSRVVGVDLADDVVFACLARYDSQKNIAGLVAAFGRAAARSDTPVRLVCAGDPSDWVELRRADALRRAGDAADRMHLLGNSDARTLLTAADAFVLDSFFEGWPVAATEAAAFGRPLLLSDVGGGRELVARDPDRSMLVPNATGEASLVSDRRVRSARRRARRQPNSDAVEAAVAAIGRTVAHEREQAAAGRDDADRAGIAAMLAQHAEAIRSAATQSGASAATGPHGSSQALP